MCIFYVTQKCTALIAVAGDGGNSWFVYLPLYGILTLLPIHTDKIVFKMFISKDYDVLL